MKMLKKLALVSAISAISVSAFAMEAMDDETMSATTGQDGITIVVKPGEMTRALLNTDFGVTTNTIAKVADASAGYYANGDANINAITLRQVVIHDDDGVVSGQSGFLVGKTENSGALVIGNGAKNDSTVLFADGSKPIVVTLDMVGDATGGGGDNAMLNIAISTPRLGIKVGSIGVANSNAASSTTDADGGATGTLNVDGSTNSGRVEILSSMEIVMGEATTNIQLGHESQGAMIVMNTALVGGLVINNFALNDAAGVTSGPLGTVLTGGGQIAVGSLVMKDAGGSDLTVKATIDVGTISTSTFGATSNPTLTSVNANLTTAVQDSVTNAGTAGAFKTYAALQTAAFGANGIDDGGAGDDNAAAYTALTAVNTGVTNTVATKRGELQTASQNVYNGLVVQMSQLGDANNGIDMSMNNVGIGKDTDAATAGWQGKDIGDIQILGLNLSGTTLIISGH